MDLVASAFLSLCGSFFTPSSSVFSSAFLLPRPLPGFLFFFLGFTLRLPRTLTLHLTFGLAVHLLYHYTTVIS